MSLGTSSLPLRVAIIGSGPSGFYAADSLLKSDLTVDVDLFERLPVPFGLVRFGVAPDHWKIKTVTRVYEKTATHERFHFFGNVDVGKDITIDELKKAYDALIFTVGAQTDRSLGIPGEDLPGSYTATEFVAWYNGHPDYRDRQFDLSSETAMIIGQGNVAIDVARILARTVDELKSTDIAAYALAALAESRVREIYLVGRRGPVQAAFTLVEIREMGELQDCNVIVDPDDVVLNDASRAELDMPGFEKNKNNYAVLKKFSERETGTKTKNLRIRFFRSPIELKGDGRLQQVVLEKNELSGEPGKQKARGTGETETLDGELFFRSVGYRGVPVDGVPFNESWGVFPNEKGRLQSDGKVVAGLYAAGWIKRGPSGVIGTNKKDSAETVESLIEDVPHLEPCEKPDSQAVSDLLAERKVRVVSFDDWRKIDKAELDAGKAAGKAREKFVTVQDMLGVLG